MPTSFDTRRLKVLKARRIEKVHDSLEATFALSLDALTDADRRLYVALAIFEEDEGDTGRRHCQVVERPGRPRRTETGDLLADLADRALLARSGEDGDAITLHDLLLDFVMAELGEEGRIAAHHAILDSYRQSQQGEGWHTAPDDGYLCDHLAYHLDAVAGQNAAAEVELHGLFADDASASHARVPQSGYLYDGYLADLEATWHRANAEVYCESEDSSGVPHPRPLRKIRNHPNQYQCPG